jgi:WD40 repeat protein
MVKIWDVAATTCLQSLKGHVSNVFSALFFTRDRNEVISGGNDADIRHYQVEGGTCTVYGHHCQKVLQLAANPKIGPTFLSSSADGTVRFFDTRLHYKTNTQVERELQSVDESVSVVPQFFGGGRVGRSGSEPCEESLLLNYRLLQSTHASSSSSPVLYSVNWHPINEFLFIVSSSAGDVRLFDMRKIDVNPNNCYVNIYSFNAKLADISGCAFSKDGTEIIATCLDDNIYLFDTDANFEEYYDYRTGRRPTRKRTPPSNATTTAATTRSTTTTMPSSTSTDSSTLPLSSSTPSSPRETDQPRPTPISKCTICEKTENLQRCARCKQCWYCCRDHQREHWPTHKLTCGQPAKKPENRSDEAKGGKEGEKEGSKPQPYVACYSAHTSRKTIKGCAFYGPNSEFVITGSDDARIYLYDKESTRLVQVLEGHESVVNCIASHPSTPMLASSGIDHVVKIWENCGYPSQEGLCKREKKFEALARGNNEETAESSMHEQRECLIQ